jgi:hypothetical protein
VFIVKYRYTILYASRQLIIVSVMLKKVDPGLDRKVWYFLFGNDNHLSPTPFLVALPQGYDHKYTYSHIGYNLKISDMQAACGLAQLHRLPEFIEKRNANFNYLKQRLSSVTDFIELTQATQNSTPSWFGFPITLKDNAGVSRVDLTKYLDQNKIGTRLLFAGTGTGKKGSVTNDNHSHLYVTRLYATSPQRKWIEKQKELICQENREFIWPVYPAILYREAMTIRLVFFLNKITC